ncbi:MAG: monofunctional biosynthetic peptidoglycan transglycosylase [Fibromonadales bacterium]|nr:monofunctional biosynthetic peptidoglycan transglycosylase [Fibromonadales bacterium]
MKIFKNIYKALNFMLRVVLLLFILYSIAFSLACTWGAWKVYSYGNAILQEVEILKYSQPERSAFMDSLHKVSPKLNIKHRFVPLDSISPYLQKAVVAGEDAGFYFHPGFDVRAIAEALDANQKRKKTMFGGSTLTQQLAKNLFLSPQRSWERKIKELAYAVLMERYLGKDRILELYLNYAQWGKNIFGCETASQHYYKKPCAKLTVDQSVNLAAMLASPGRHHPEMRESRFMRERRNMIYRNMFPPKDSVLVDSLKGLTEP